MSFFEFCHSEEKLTELFPMSSEKTKGGKERDQSTNLDKARRGRCSHGMYGSCAPIPWRSSPANASYDDFSNARTPQNRDSNKSVEVGCVQLLFEPAAIRLNGFHTYLQLRCNFGRCFAIAK
jgi:hypothetical protein